MKGTRCKEVQVPDELSPWVLKAHRTSLKTWGWCPQRKGE